MKKLFFIFVNLLFTVSVFSQWSLTGNLGTTNSNFLGTTDNRPVILKAYGFAAGYTGYKDNNNVSFGYLSLQNVLLTRGDEGNTALGAQSLKMAKKDSVVGNVGIGIWALEQDTASRYNVAIGASAMYNTKRAGMHNVAVGQKALANNIDSMNTAVGSEAALSNTIGKGITAVGFKALNQNTTGEFNTALGFQALLLNRTGRWNVALGSGSLQRNTTGFLNTAGGNSSMHFNTTGHENTAFGEQALGGNIDGYFNTAVGCRALWSVKRLQGNDTGYGHGNSNTAIGYEALRDIIKGSNNVAVGRHALRADTTGNDNVAVGNYALTYNFNGHNNVAIGRSALYDNTTASNNVAVGYMALHAGKTVSGLVAVGGWALMANTSGTENTAIGVGALRTNTTGSSNTAIGAGVLYNNISGSENTAVGVCALGSNTTGYWNTVIGSRALERNTEGCHNTANGMWALRDNTTGSWNTATGTMALMLNFDGEGNTANGVYALLNNKSGKENVASGVSALQNNTFGSYNTATGRSSLLYNTTGNSNTAVGLEALRDNTIGSNNTAIGYGANVNKNNLTNATAIGYGAVVDSSNKVVIGNTSVSRIGGYVTWTTYPSDGQAKQNIKQNVPGLAFINLLQPVTYNLNLNVIDDLQKSDDPKINHFRDSLRLARSPEEIEIDEKARADKEKQVYSGFIAQDVEKAARSVGYDFSGVDAPENGKGVYGLRYAEFVVPLVKAVQELSEQNEAKDAAIASLQEQVKELSVIVNRLLEKENYPFPDASNTVSIPDASLEQNFPNPFNRTTTINYVLPKTFNSARIIISDTFGNVYKQISLSGTGAGSTEVVAGFLPAGIYNYSLYVDNSLVDTKKMVLTK